MPRLDLMDVVRSPTTGAITSVTVVVPTKHRGQTPEGSAVVELDIDPIEADDVTKTLSMNLYELRNSVWRHVVGCTWRGGGVPDDDFLDRNPRLAIPISRIIGQTVKLEIDDPGGMNIGYKVGLEIL